MKNAQITLIINVDVDETATTNDIERIAMGLALNVEGFSPEGDETMLYMGVTVGDFDVEISEVEFTTSL